VYLESPESKEQIIRGIKEINAPISVNMLEGGGCAGLGFSELKEMGLGRISIPMFSTFVTAQALRNGFKYLIEHGTSVGYEDHYMDFPEYQRLTFTPEVRVMEKKYLP
jgi:2-methylisocitrate lyase-like PEP mutase family enzyme